MHTFKRGMQQLL